MQKKTSGNDWSWEPFESYDKTIKLSSNLQNKSLTLPKDATNGVCCGRVFGHTELVPAVGQTSSNSGMRMCCHMVTLRESPQPAGADSSGGDHGCSVGKGKERFWLVVSETET